MLNFMGDFEEIVENVDLIMWTCEHKISPTNVLPKN